MSLEVVSAVNAHNCFLCLEYIVSFLRAAFWMHGSIDARHCRTTQIGHFFTARPAILSGWHKKAQTENQSKISLHWPSGLLPVACWKSLIRTRPTPAARSADISYPLLIRRILPICHYRLLLLQTRASTPPNSRQVCKTPKSTWARRVVSAVSVATRFRSII